jgi:5-methylcytosine-specific restriction endonuclease McrA
LSKFNAVRNSQGLRAAVWDRDKGLCRTCGLDCTALDTLLGKWRRSPKTRHLARRARQSLGLNKPYRRTTWDADHIVAVKDGGGACGVGNVQTLCVWCHRKKTGEQRGQNVNWMLPGAVLVARVMEPLKGDAERVARRA